MSIPCPKPLRQARMVLGCAVLIAATSAWGGEKIRFSEDAEKPASPSQRPQADFFRGGLDLKQSAPGGTEYGPPIPPPSSRKARDPKLEEWIDQKKNWIFSTPSKTDSDAAVQEIFKVREYNFDSLGTDNKPKSAIDRYFEREAELRKEFATKLNERGKEKETEAGSGEDEPVDRSPIGGLPLEPGARSSISPVPELDPGGWSKKGAALGNPISAAPGDFSPRNFNAADVLGFPRTGVGGGPNQFVGQEQREQRLEEFQKTLGVVTPTRSLLRDPINLQNDTTRRPLNPILGTGASEVGIGRSGAIETGLSSAGDLGSVGIRPGISDLMSARPPAGSSLSPAAVMPPPPVLFQPRPAVLEIPRRKF